MRGSARITIGCGDPGTPKIFGARVNGTIGKDDLRPAVKVPQRLNRAGGTYGYRISCADRLATCRPLMLNGILERSRCQNAVFTFFGEILMTAIQLCEKCRLAKSDPYHFMRRPSSRPAVLRSSLASSVPS